jgi:hypothetical protein
MIDNFVLLTPLLTLPIVLLFVYVGCALSHRGYTMRTINLRLHLRNVLPRSQVNTVQFTWSYLPEGVSTWVSDHGIPSSPTESPSDTVYEYSLSVRVSGWRNVGLACVLTPVGRPVVTGIASIPDDQTSHATSIVADFDLQGTPGMNIPYPTITTT